MLGRLILGLIWLTCVQSEIMNIMPMEETPMASKASMTMSMGAEDSMGAAAPMPKAKRYLFHHHSSPCPPFYPHFHMQPEPMHAMKPYGPPSYPKSDVHVQHYNHQPPQFIHQPTYTSYVPKQTVQYVKHQISPPIYHQPVISPPIQHVHPIQPAVIKPLQRWFPFSQQMHEHKVSYPKQPMFSYAPAYHKHMPMFWPISQMKKIDYPVAQVSYPKQTVIYNHEVPKCAPCPQHQALHQHVQQPSISYVKVAQPIHHVAQPPPSKVYLPAPTHQQLVKPCDK